MATNLAFELFLLSTNLSQFKSKVLITKLFIESINSLFEGHEFSWSLDEPDLAETKIQVCTRFKNYGHIHFHKQSSFTEETFSLLQNAVQLLAIQLEKIDQEAVLENQKEHLNILVQEKTKDLIESQNELARQNEELLIAKKEAEESERQNRTILQTALDGFWIVDLNGRFTEVNNAYCQLTGYSRAEMLTMSIPDVEVLESEAEVHQRIQRLRQNGSDRFKSKHRCKNGRIIDVEVSINLLKDDAKFFVFVLDITERKQAQKSAVERENRIGSIYRSAPVGIGLVNNRYFINVNDRLCEMTGYLEDELINQSSEILYPSKEDYEYVGKEKYKQIKKYGTGTVETHFKRI